VLSATLLGALFFSPKPGTPLLPDPPLLEEEQRGKQ
jgi:hypothetical protein